MWFLTCFALSFMVDFDGYFWKDIRSLRYFALFLEELDERLDRRNGIEVVTSQKSKLSAHICSLLKPAPVSCAPDLLR